MIPIELVKKIKRIQIQTAHRVDGLLAGEYLSAFKGRGIEFEEVRPYQPGDDVRTIDWNVTARHGEPFVKLFREERELTVMQLVDVSASQGLGCNFQTKRDLITELRSVTFLISDFFDDRFEKALRIASKKHDIIPIIVSDHREFEMPNVGLIDLKDSETGQIISFDTGSRRQREQYQQRSLQQKTRREHIFQRLKMEPIHIFTGENYSDPLREYFHRRGGKR
jgi:hypothetical protein